jgi:hypothetical protein
MSDKQNSMSVNKGVLANDLGLRQLSNTAIFLKENIFVWSPSAQNDHNWFDLAKANLDRYEVKPYKGFLLVRFFDKLLLTELDSFIKEMMPSDKFVSTNSIRPHWKFRIRASGGRYFIINHQNPKKLYPITAYTPQQLQQIIN